MKDALNKIAFENCKEVKDLYGKCMFEKKWTAPVSCQDSLNTLNDCLDKWTNDESFEKFKAAWQTGL